MMPTKSVSTVSLRRAQARRISQLAFLGQITTRAGVRLPGDIDYSGTSFADIGEGWSGSLQVPVAGALQILAFVGALELGVMKDVTGENEFVGDFRNGALTSAGTPLMKRPSSPSVPLN
ncbi:chlorophyll a-b binding domain-containing protein [Skeletonema marinoi]|uniref:Chlorophyll a-b binding domain-containing protein n=1 Tax=Skeletonema marinoi TaxID=267567 RepID=A0AAD8Y7H8_9STRA|nr:chlorophyll a-b binding domain-containing protein [Skeletonema marinoi]